MRVWLDPDRLQSLGLTASDVTPALQGQNVQVAAGVLNQPPVRQPGAFQIAVQTLGPARRPGRVRRHRRQADRRTRSCGSRTSRASSSPRSTTASTPISTASPRSASASSSCPARTRSRPRKSDQGDHGGAVARLSRRASNTPSSTTRPSSSSSRSTPWIETIFEAIVLVVLVVILFLQTWRAAIIPIVAIPVSLIGTFFVMALFGFSLNNLSLFGLVLAIGIVVDDAIVVVENVERNIAAGLSPARSRAQEHGRGRRGADRHRAGAVRGVRAVGLHHRHFRPVLPPVRAHHRRRDGHLADRVADAVAGALRAAVEAARRSTADRWWAAADPRLLPARSTGLRTARRAATAGSPARVVRFAVIMLVVYAGVIAFGLNEFRKTPVGFIPQHDRGYLITVTQLPPGASLARTDAVNRRAVEIALQVPGVAHAVNIVGFSGATFTNAPNAGAVFVVLKPFEERAQGSEASRRPRSRARCSASFAAIQEALRPRRAAAAGARHRQLPAASA